MKKAIASLLVTIVLVSGLVAISGTTASASCPVYSGCPMQHTKIVTPRTVERFDRARICVRVFVDGDGTPQGRVTVRVQRSLGGFRYEDRKRLDDRGKACFRTPRLRKVGKHVIRAQFDRKPGTKWRDSDNASTFRVVRRR